MPLSASGGWVLQTRLRPPRLRPDVVGRPRLMALLQETMADCPVTLVSAPAGSGKTTLLAGLPQACPDMAVAWLALEIDDNDPGHFLTSLTAALSRVCTATEQALENFGSNREHAEAEFRQAIRTLVSDVAESTDQPFILVLDDVHQISSPQVLAGLEYLIEHLPPQMRLVLSTRHDPPMGLARLRVRHQLAELRLDDLRFTEQEAADLLNGVLDLNLTEEQLRLVSARTEGWAAGLSLLISSLRRARSPEDRRAVLAHLPEMDRHVFNFLAVEVFQSVEPDAREFLLKTSVLIELSPEVCRAVTGREDASLLLEQLYSRNLFMTATEGEGRAWTYRYHDLFREFLLQQVKWNTPELLVDLHRRAGAAETVPTRKIWHFLAGQSWDEAADVIERVGGKLIRSGMDEQLRRSIETLPSAVRARRPRLSLIQGGCASQRWNWAAAASLLQEAVHGFTAIGDEGGRGEASTYLAAALRNLERFEEAEIAVRDALNSPIWGIVLMHARWTASMLARRRGDHATADAHFDAALAGFAHDNPVVVATLFSQSALSPFMLEEGGVHRLERFSQMCLSFPVDQAGPLYPLGLGTAAFVDFWRGRWAEAIEGARRALEESRHHGRVRWVEVGARVIIPVLLSLTGHEDEADQEFDQLLTSLEQEYGSGVFAMHRMSGILHMLARIRFLQRRWDDVRAISERMRRAWTAAGHTGDAPALRAMEMMLHLLEKDFAAVEPAMIDWVQAQSSAGILTDGGSARGTLAYMYLRLGRTEEALATFVPLLAAAERDDVPGLLLSEGTPVAGELVKLALERNLHADFASRVLALAGGEPEAEESDEDDGHPDQRIPIPGSQEFLTAREAEILALVGAGLTNKAIAAQLFLSPFTVKRHVSNLFAKLGAATRTEAAARAREFGITPK